MEMTSAACAKEWSIKLEKGLRSKKLDQHNEAIKEIGPKLQQWSMEPGITMAISDMYGLVPGEERLFANTILLRLADAFRSGDNSTRISVLKVFLLELKHLFRKGVQYDGILAKQRVPNYVELLKRVKMVFDTGDVEAKSLALCLFGCWADFAKDSTHVRHMILSSLWSPHIRQVKASLFAAGCFCRLSEDFACIILEILFDIISSIHASVNVKLSAIRVFAKMQCSYIIATRAYKAAKKLLLGSLQHELVDELLLSLSKLAIKSTLLISEQVDLLLQFISGGTTSLKATALKCIYSLLDRGTCQFPVNRYLFAELFHVIGDNDLPLNFGYEALRILCKIFCHMPPDMSYMNMPELLKLVQVVENALQSSFKAKRCLALGLLVNMMCSVKKTRGWNLCLSTEKWPFKCFLSEESLQGIGLSSIEDSPACLVCHVITLVFSHINSLVREMNVELEGKLLLLEDISCDSLTQVNQECRHLLDLILHLVEEYPTSGPVVLDCMRYLIESLINVHDQCNLGMGDACEDVSQTDKGAKNPSANTGPPYSSNNKKLLVISKLISCISRSVTACLKILDENNRVSVEVYQSLKILIECLRQSQFCDIHEVFSLSMHFYTVYHYSGIGNASTQESDKSPVSPELGSPHVVCWVCQEWHTLECTKKMAKERDCWAAYRAARYACCEGLWFAAAFTFRKLIDCVQSDSCHRWLKSLMLLAGCESEIKLLLFPKVGIELINGFHRESNLAKPFSCVEGGIGCCTDGNTNLHDYEGKLMKAYSRICSSQEMLVASGGSNGIYYFQRWFLSLRAEVLEVLVSVLGLMSSHKFPEDNFNQGPEGSINSHSTTFTQSINAVTSGLVSASFRLNKLAKDYDLLATSFSDIDSQSFRGISKIALDCSLLAFCSAFALLFSSSPACVSLSSPSSENLELSYALILQDLVERLWNLENKTVVRLQQFMLASRKVADNLQTRTQMNKSSHMDKTSLLVYEFAVSRVLGIQEDSKLVKDEKDLHVLFMQGLQLLSDIIRKWMGMSFRIPKYYFKVRPCIGAELFIFNADSKRTNDLSIFPGFRLSLNLCLQLRNASIDHRGQVAKMYCILATSRSECLSIGGGESPRQTGWNFQAQKTDEMVELYEKLILHIKSDIKKADRGFWKASEIDDLVTSFACFDPNEKGQGFSSCLLNVSAFPEGSYQIKWHSCYVDDKGALWSLLPLNSGLTFSIKRL